MGQDFVIPVALAILGQREIVAIEQQTLVLGRGQRMSEHFRDRGRRLRP